jgi:hypothetical protein
MIYTGAAFPAGLRAMTATCGAAIFSTKFSTDCFGVKMLGFIGPEPSFLPCFSAAAKVIRAGVPAL